MTPTHGRLVVWLEAIVNGSVRSLSAALCARADAKTSATQSAANARNRPRSRGLRALHWLMNGCVKFPPKLARRASRRTLGPANGRRTVAWLYDDTKAAQRPRAEPVD